MELISVSASPTYLIIRVSGVGGPVAAVAAVAARRKSGGRSRRSDWPAGRSAGVDVAGWRKISFD